MVRKFLILLFLLPSLLIAQVEVKDVAGVPHTVYSAGNVTFVEQLNYRGSERIFPVSGVTVVYRGEKSYADIVTSGVVGDATATILLTSTGDGTGVAVLRMESSEDVVITLSGTGKFYSDDAGTLDESSSWTLTTGALRTIYLKVPSGTSDMVIANCLAVTKVGETTTNGWDGIGADTNAPTMTATNWSQCTNLTNISAFGCNLTGSVAEWSALTKLIYLYCYSTNVEGDVSGWSALTKLTNLYCYNTNVEGDVSGWSALTKLTYLRCNSTNVEGDVSGWSALTKLTNLRCHSTNVEGDVSGWSALTSTLLQHQCCLVRYRGMVTGWC